MTSVTWLKELAEHASQQRERERERERLTVVSRESSGRSDVM